MSKLPPKPINPEYDLKKLELDLGVVKQDVKELEHKYKVLMDGKQSTAPESVKKKQNARKISCIIL